MPLSLNVLAISAIKLEIKIRRLLCTRWEYFQKHVIRIYCNGQLRIRGMIKHKREKAQSHKLNNLRLKTLKLNLKSNRNIFITGAISRDIKRKGEGVETQSAFPNRSILLVHSRVSVSGKKFFSLLSGSELRARFFERADIIALLDVRASSEHSRKASSSSVLSHSLAALFILFWDPCTTPIPPYLFFFFFFFSAHPRRRNDFSELCVSMTMVQNSARD